MIKKRNRGPADILRDLPMAIFVIIAINVVAFIFTRHSPSPFPDVDYSPIRIYGLKPSDVHVGKLLTSAFVHDGIVHLGANMLLLYIFGRGVERAMGRLEFVIFYVGACFASSIVHVGMTLIATFPAYYADMPIIGASGAVAAVMGVYAVRFHRRAFKFAGAEFPVPLVILVWLVSQIVLAVLGLYDVGCAVGLNLKLVSYWSHLGGFAFGIAVALITDMALAGEREHLIEQAQANYGEGSLLEATRNFEAILKYDPEDAFSHAELGRHWAILEEEDQSLPYYEAAIALYVAQGKEEEAFATAEEMTQFWPNAKISAATRLRLASYMAETGDTARAIRAFREIADEDEDSLEKQMALLKIGHLQLVAFKDPTAAAETLRAFLEQHPRSEWRRFAEDTLARAEAQR